MIRFHHPPAPDNPERAIVAAGRDLADALALFGQVQDCIDCSAVVAAPTWTSGTAIDRVVATLKPMTSAPCVVRPGSTAGDLLRRGSHWTDVNIDARAQRLSTVKMPTSLASAQRMMAINDLRQNIDARPVVAIGLWALFAHPVVRSGARLGGITDGLTAEIALTLHPDRYVVLDQDRNRDLTFVVASPDIVVTELLVLGIRQQRSRIRESGPWEDPLVQAATELDLGVRSSEAIVIDAVVSPTLSPDALVAAEASLRSMAESIGVSIAS